MAMEQDPTICSDWGISKLTGCATAGGRKIPPGFRQFNEKRQAMLNANFADPKEARNCKFQFQWS